MRLWLLNRRRDQWKERQEVTVADPLASMTPEQRLAQVVESWLVPGHCSQPMIPKT
jgi:hypothetical protein